MTTTAATKTSPIETAAAKLAAAGYEVATRELTDATSYWAQGFAFTATKGSHIVTATPERGGTTRLAMYLDNGPGTDRMWCDGASLKSAAGIAKRAASFLR